MHKQTDSITEFILNIVANDANWSWMAVVTPTDHLKSAHNRCVSEVLVAFLCCRFAFLDFLLVSGFYHSTGSDLFLFL